MQLSYISISNYRSITDAYKLENRIMKMSKMVSIGSDAKREIDDIELSRYACYLIVMNGDSRKEVIAIGQIYFAIKQDSRNLLMIMKV